MIRKYHVKSFTLLLTMLLLSLSVSTVFAGAPLDLHIEAEETLGTSGEAFFASGGAVDAGLICPTGTVDDESIKPGGGSGSFVIFQVLKRFNCGDGSGSFDIMLIVKLDLTTNQTTARWNVIGGTGDYSGLHGVGSLVGTPIVPGESIFDVYDGIVN